MSCILLLLGKGKSTEAEQALVKYAAAIFMTETIKSSNQSEYTANEEHRFRR
jgi:hypothetical protein